MLAEHLPVPLGEPEVYGPPLSARAPPEDSEARGQTPGSASDGPESARAAELRRALCEALGEEEYLKHASQLEGLSADSLDDILAGLGSNDGASCAAAPVEASTCGQADEAPEQGDVSGGGPPGHTGPPVVPPVDLTGVGTGKAEELRVRLREVLGEEQFAKHAAQLSELGIESLQDLLDSLTKDDECADGSSARDGLERPSMPEDLAANLGNCRELTLPLLAKGTTQKARKGESQNELLARLTHLQLSEKKLSVLGDLVHRTCPGLRVLYLSENRLHSIGALPAGLESVFLQDNEIWEMSSWSEKLPHLQTLNLNDNRVSLVDGLSSSSRLQELSVRRQRQPDGSQLQFAPGTLAAIGCSLRVLDVAENSLTSLEPLSGLTSLLRLDATRNALASMAAVTPLLRSARDLRTLKLEGNPLCAAGQRYRDEVVVQAHNLQELDGKEIGSRERVFVHELSQRRRQRSQSRKRTPSESPHPDGERQGSGGARPPRMGASESPRGRCPSGGSSGPRRTLSSQGSRSLAQDNAAFAAAGAMGGPPVRVLRKGKGAESDSSSLPRLPPLLPAVAGADMGTKKMRQRQIDIA